MAVTSQLLLYIAQNAVIIFLTLRLAAAINPTNTFRYSKNIGSQASLSKAKKPVLFLPLGVIIKGILNPRTVSIRALKYVPAITMPIA